MRTRLNEIVDRLFCDVGRYVDPVIIKGLAGAACEEAFRHGVERAAMYEVSNIQAAPAEEKCLCGCGHPATCEGCLDRDEPWSQRVGKWGHVCTNACHIGMGHFVPDRRKGQRRKGLEWTRLKSPIDVPEYATTFGDRINDSGKDRRSGQDRRKS